MLASPFRLLRLGLYNASFMSAPRAKTKGDGLTAGVLAAVFGGLYGLTLCRTVYWYDSAELVTAAVTLGITHPPGYPLYTLLAHGLTWLPIEPALAVNLMSAVFGAAAVALVFAVGRQLGLERPAAALGAAVLGTGRVFWSNAVVAEVYTPAVAAAALVLLLLLRGADEHRFELSLLGAWLAGLSLGLHMSIATLGLGFAWLVWVNGRRIGRLIAAAGAAALGSLIFLYIPLRSARNPALNICDPSTPAQLAWYLSGGAYRHWFGADSGGLLERGAALGGALSDQLGWAGIALSLVGIAWLSRQRTEACLALVLMAAGNLAFFFRYRAHDVEVFLLPTTMLLCCFAGAGAQALWSQIGRAVKPGRAKAARAVVAGALFLLPLRLGYASYQSADMSRFDETESFVRAMEQTLPQDAVILNFTTPPEWKRYAVFGMYDQLVRERRRDVTHVIAPDLRKLARDFDPQDAIYLYAPVEMLDYFFETQPEGPLIRVLGPKPDAAVRAPRKTKKGRTCWN